MKRNGFVAAAAAGCMVLSACRGQEAPAPAPAKAAVTPPASVHMASGTSIRSRIHPDLPEFTITVMGDSPAEARDTLRVKRIEIRRGAAIEPLQIIDGLDTATPIANDRAGLSVLDMNFDGYGDIRLVEFQPAGPNVPYLNWLFDPATARFVENRALNGIASPQFDPVTREIRSNWRDGAARYGADVYVFREGQPLLVRKEVKDYKSPGMYTLQVSKHIDGTWKTVEQREVREP